MSIRVLQKMIRQIILENVKHYNTLHKMLYSEDVATIQQAIALAEDTGYLTVHKYDTKPWGRKWRNTPEEMRKMEHCWELCLELEFWVQLKANSNLLPHTGIVELENEKIEFWSPMRREDPNLSITVVEDPNNR